MDIKELKKAFRSSWDISTCYPGDRDKWTSQRPETGQCAITALIINDLYGGEILYSKEYHHYWNRIAGNIIVDLTRSQFSNDAVIEVDGVANREYILKSESALKAKTMERYQILKNRFEGAYASTSIKK